MCKKTAVITGASGFLGQHFVENFSSELRIISVSQKKVTWPNVQNVQIDFSKSDTFFELLLKECPDYIFNFRACFENAFETSFKVNVDFPRKMLDFLSEHKLSSKVVLVGSAAEYGFNDINQPLTESHSLAPNSVYGVTKAMQSLLPSLYKQTGVDVVYARIFNLYGPNINKNLLPGLLAQKISDFLSGKIKKITLRPLTDTYDFIPVKEALNKLKIIAEKGQSAEIYNVGSGTPCLVRDFVKQQLKQHKLIFTNVINESSENADHKRKTIVACTKKFDFLQRRNCS